jgi:hypothetical protein
MWGARSRRKRWKYAWMLAALIVSRVLVGFPKHAAPDVFPDDVLTRHSYSLLSF